ncbi:MAG: excinuclease ABC subunit UvrA [Desulfobacteraceae bacterium]|nr:excinuclease ABC subunit UvrA [Desulfobacteraceae bacterium]
MASEHIVIRGARQHNLKNINLDLPRNRLIVITGLSGSGKSTLAFDTLYAEGQRRYVESLSTYARQFLERLEKPDVDLIEGLSPAIAIEQRSAAHNPRSTVGTVTEIYDYLRLLFARVGSPHCYRCGEPIVGQSLDQIVERILDLPDRTRLLILAPVANNAKGAQRQLLTSLRKDGFARVRIDGEMKDLAATDRLAPNRSHTIEVVVDRLVIKEGIRNRLADSLELALSLSEGMVIVDIPGGDTIEFSEKAGCSRCGVRYPAFTPASFSFNSPHGACPDCDGLGSRMDFDEERIVPNRELSLREGAVVPWANRNTVHFSEFLDALTSHYGADIYTPFGSLPEGFQRVLLYGSGDEEVTFYFERENRRHFYRKPFEGIIPNLRRRFLETDSSPVREEIRRYMTFHPCPECRGMRLNRASRNVRIGDLNIGEVCSLSITRAAAFLQSLELEGRRRLVASRILKEIGARLGFLEKVGLEYLTLDRSAATLSGGESQRIRLATQIGSKLTGVLYVLDEPSIGLHPRDNRRLLDALMQMRDLGNTVLVVEHDAETIRSADYVVDMGPAAGVHGGEVVFAGEPLDLLQEASSVTGQFLSGARSIPCPERRRVGNGKKLLLQGASSNNLKNIDVAFPLGCLICVTGVSGSGKSTLVLETLYPALARKIYRSRTPAGEFRDLSGLDHVDKVVHIDQSPIGKTPRSNPGTYTGVFTFIRDLFSRTPDARMRGYKAGRFSFNVRGGRCEACAGDGIVKIEMHFLPDVYVPCDVCQGRRYNRETLEIRYRGKNIAEVLDMTVNQALAFFSRIRSIRDKLQTLADVGLGYIGLGQSATTLSGGEAQRVKLARELSKRGTGETIYILDEPTTGLHAADIEQLLQVLDRLVENGNTVIVIEHNLDVIKTADHVIDLGPEGGEDGGTVIGFGPPEELATIETSHTGRFLRVVLPA